MLSQIQSRDLNRFKKINIFLNANQDVTATYLPFALEVVEYAASLALLEAMLSLKNGITSGITSNKTELKQQIADDLAPICTTTRAYAIKFNNPQLAAEADHRAAAIFGLKDSDILPFVQHITALISPLFSNVNYQTYGVTEGRMEDLTELAQTFDNLIGLAANTLSESTIANENINLGIKNMLVHLIQFDLLIEFFNQSNPGFVNAYYINSAVDNVGIRHSGIEGVITSSATGFAVPYVTLTLDDTGKTTKTNLLGQYRLLRILTGDYNITITAAGYQTKTILHHIDRGRVDILNIQLES